MPRVLRAPAGFGSACKSMDSAVQHLFCAGGKRRGRRTFTTRTPCSGRRTAYARRPLSIGMAGSLTYASLAVLHRGEGDMGFWSFLNHWWNLPFLVMLGLCGVFVLLQAIGLIGGSHSELEHAAAGDAGNHDVDHELPADTHAHADV